MSASLNDYIYNYQVTKFESYDIQWKLYNTCFPLNIVFIKLVLLYCLRDDKLLEKTCYFSNIEIRTLRISMQIMNLVRYKNVQMHKYAKIYKISKKYTKYRSSIFTTIFNR